MRPHPKDFSAKTAAEAVRKREEYRKQYERNPWADRATPIAPYIRDEFIPFGEAQYNAGELSWGRYSERKSRLERFVLNSAYGQLLCRIAIGNLTPKIVERYFDELLRHRVSPNRRNMIRQDLMIALRKAKRRLPLPVTEYFADVPLAKEERKRKALFNPQDVLDRVHDDSLPAEARLPVAFEFVINCRPSEMFALKRTDIDWRTGTITICKAMQRDRHGFKVNDTTKTGRKGDRVVPLGSLLAPLLKRVQKERMSRGNASEYVFCRQNGQPHDKDSFAYEWARIRVTLGLPEGPTFYSLKTAGNSYALANGGLVGRASQEDGAYEYADGRQHLPAAHGRRDRLCGRSLRATEPRGAKGKRGGKVSVRTLRGNSDQSR